MPTNLRNENLSNEQVNTAHERWYAAQPTTRCHRCDREFPNLDGGKAEYCSKDCEFGFFTHPYTPAPKSKVAKKGKHYHQPVSSFRSNWS